MSNVNDELKEQLKGLEGNYFGWKWSFISLGLILIGVVALVAIGPKKIENTNENGTFEVDSTAVNSERE
jgi:hypothetical protein